jgi:hypothetical protein
MAHNSLTRKPKREAEAPDPGLLAHIAALGLTNVEDYVAWCVRHGFSRRTGKNSRQRLKERAFATAAAADRRLAQQKRETRSPEKTITSILRGQLEEGAVTQPYLKAISRVARAAPPSPRTRQAFLDLLLHAGRCADLFAAGPVIPHYGRGDANTFVGGLLALAQHAQDWLRPPGDWKPRTHNSHRQFSSLARHLLAHWPVPTFMDSVWFKGFADEALRHQRWFLHIGRGENIRTADLPLPYTKRMAHHFLQAPADFTVEAALRWGQIHGLGGDARLARAVSATRLGSDFAHEEFWVTVLRFFIANPMLDVAHIGPILDYIHQQRFVAQEVFVAPGVRERRGPPQPNFTMKGRTPASLLRQVEAWHRTLARVQQPQAEWPASGIKGFTFVEGSERGGSLKVWTITELRDTRALVAEGRLMKHCVASYASSCARGDCSIWALEVETFEGRAKVLTVEVRNSLKLICQARGKCNALPAEKHRGILRRWAEQAGLQLASCV